MTTGPASLPDGFTVRIHDDVEVGAAALVSGRRVARVSSAATHLLCGRTLTVSSRTSAALAARLLDLDLADPVLDTTTSPGLDQLTVVIPVRDEPAGVHRLLSAVAPHVRCIVVDDASAQQQEVIEAVSDHGAEVLPLDANVGPAAARNVGLGMVRTPFVAFVDSDVDVSVAALVGLLAHLADPGLAIVAPRVRSVTGVSWIERYELTEGSLDLGPTPATVRQWSSVAYVPSACMVARVDAIGDGFDPALRSGEDVDLVWRLQDAGHRVRYAAEIVVHHDTRTKLGPWLRRKAFYGTSAAPLALRHGERMAPAVMTGDAMAAILAALLQRPWAAAASTAFASRVAAKTWNSVPELTNRQKRALVAANLTGLVSQTSALVLRHWVPATIAACAVSTRARRATALFAVADTVLAHRRHRPCLDLLRFGALRQAEHAAYGFGVWAAAIRGRTTSSLVPRRRP